MTLLQRNKHKEITKMGRQETTPQKEKEEYPEKELNEIEVTNLLDIEFKVMVIRMLKELSGNNIIMKRDIETMNKNQLEMKIAISEMKNTLEGIKSRLDEAED